MIHASTKGFVGSGGAIICFVLFLAFLRLGAVKADVYSPGLITKSKLPPKEKTTFGMASLTNTGPRVRISWPPDGSFFGSGTFLWIRAEPSTSDGAITEVRFFVDNEMIGIVTNSPYVTRWVVNGPSGIQNIRVLSAIALDTKGRSASAPGIQLSYSGTRPVAPVMEITSPPDGWVLPEHSAFKFGSRLLANTGDIGAPVEYYIGTNLIGRIDIDATQYLEYSITVSNLTEGTYLLGTKYRGSNADNCLCKPVTIRMTRLGVRNPILLDSGDFQFEVVTTYLGLEMIIQRSSDMLNWIPVGSIIASQNIFTFTDSGSPPVLPRFYRVLVRP